MREGVGNREWGVGNTIPGLVPPYSLFPTPYSPFFRHAPGGAS
jgi:hypothetical protein